MPDETVNEIRTGLEGQGGLPGLEHQGKIHPVAVLVEHEGQVVSPEGICRRGGIMAGGQTFIPGEEAAHVTSIDGASMGYLNDHPVFSQHFFEFSGFF